MSHASSRTEFSPEEMQLINLRGKFSGVRNKWEANVEAKDLADFKKSAYIKFGIALLRLGELIDIIGEDNLQNRGSHDNISPAQPKT